MGQEVLSAKHHIEFSIGEPFSSVGGVMGCLLITSRNM